MKVLVACEFSGVVRDAFIRRGLQATSVDLVASESDFGPHILGDVRDVVGMGWDLMVAHPPCTYLAASGARWWPKRRKEQKAALDFVRELMAAPIPYICIENPIGIISTKIRKPEQIIQPWHFGQPEWKTTCLWLKELPSLRATKIVQPDKTVGGGKRPGRVSSAIHRMSPGKNRQRERSRTYSGIAAAMAAQWGNQVAAWYQSQETRFRPGNAKQCVHGFTLHYCPDPNCVGETLRFENCSQSAKE